METLFVVLNVGLGVACSAWICRLIYQSLAD
jgi:hypothetical protein